MARDTKILCVVVRKVCCVSYLVLLRYQIRLWSQYVMTLKTVKVVFVTFECRPGGPTSPIAPFLKNRFSFFHVAVTLLMTLSVDKIVTVLSLPTLFHALVHSAEFSQILVGTATLGVAFNFSRVVALFINTALFLFLFLFPSEASSDSSSGSFVYFLRASS